MDKCPRCGADMYGCGFYHCGSTDEGFDAQHPVEYVSNDCLRRQLAQRDSRIAELEATIDEWEQKAANWMASHEAQKQLDGYRELSMRAMRAEDETGDLRAKVAGLEAKLAAAARLARDSAEAAGEMVGSKRSANDRAVERIKEYAARMINEVLDGGSYDDINAFPIAETVLDIIREEAERHE